MTIISFTQRALSLIKEEPERWWRRHWAEGRGGGWRRRAGWGGDGGAGRDNRQGFTEVVFTTSVWQTWDAFFYGRTLPSCVQSGKQFWQTFFYFWLHCRRLPPRDRSQELRQKTWMRPIGNLKLSVSVNMGFKSDSSLQSLFGKLQAALELSWVEATKLENSCWVICHRTGSQTWPLHRTVMRSLCW